MRSFKYVGPHDAVDLDGVGVVKSGATVDIEDPGISAGLDGQADWEHIPDPERSRAAKKAAESRASEES